MDFDYAHYMLTDAKKGKDNPMASSPSKEAYRKHLAETFNMKRTRILAFKNKPPTPTYAIPNNCSTSFQQSKPVKARRYIPQVINIHSFTKPISFQIQIQLLNFSFLFWTYRLPKGHWMLQIL